LLVLIHLNGAMFTLRRRSCRIPEHRSFKFERLRQASRRACRKTLRRPFPRRKPRQNEVGGKQDQRDKHSEKVAAIDGGKHQFDHGS